MGVKRFQVYFLFAFLYLRRSMGNIHDRAWTGAFRDRESYK
jgi:hypothetical protein